MEKDLISRFPLSPAAARQRAGLPAESGLHTFVPGLPFLLVFLDSLFNTLLYAEFLPPPVTVNNQIFDYHVAHLHGDDGKGSQPEYPA